MNLSKKMTIPEILKLKVELDRALFNLINDFQALTNLDIESIELNHLYHEDQKKPFVTEVQSKILIK